MFCHFAFTFFVCLFCFFTKIDTKKVKEGKRGTKNRNIFGNKIKKGKKKGGYVTVPFF